MTTQTSIHKRLLALRETERTLHDTASYASEIDTSLLAVLESPLSAHETTAAGYDRKERELGALFGTLSPIEAWRLHRRLANPDPADPLATAFSRIISQRRQRLLAFLGDPKRRAALAAMRR